MHFKREIQENRLMRLSPEKLRKTGIQIRVPFGTCPAGHADYTEADGIVTVVDAHDETVAATIITGGEPSSILVFPMEGGYSH